MIVTIPDARNTIWIDLENLTATKRK